MKQITDAYDYITTSSTAWKRVELEAVANFEIDRPATVLTDKREGAVLFPNTVELLWCVVDLGHEAAELNRDCFRLVHLGKLAHKALQS